MFCNKHLLFYTSTRATFNVTVRSGANLSRSRDKNDDNETPRKRILLFFSFFLFKRYRSFQPDTLFVARSNMEQTVFATGHRPVRNFPIDRSITMQVWIAAGHARFTGSILVHDIAIIEFSSFRNLDDEVTRSGVTAWESWRHRIASKRWHECGIASSYYVYIFCVARKRKTQQLEFSCNVNTILTQF